VVPSAPMQLARMSWLPATWFGGPSSHSDLLFLLGPKARNARGIGGRRNGASKRLKTLPTSGNTPWPPGPFRPMLRCAETRGALPRCPPMEDRPKRSQRFRDSPICTQPPPRSSSSWQKTWQRYLSKHSSPRTTALR
jgi:hypothetical protein